MRIRQIGPSDPLFDKPYEASESASVPAWDKAAPTAAPATGLSRFIKSKKKVPALLGGKRSS